MLAQARRQFCQYLSSVTASGSSPLVAGLMKDYRCVVECLKEEVLRKTTSRELLVQALHELGNLCWHSHGVQ